MKKKTRNMRNLFKQLMKEKIKQKQMKTVIFKINSKESVFNLFLRYSSLFMLKSSKCTKQNRTRLQQGSCFTNCSLKRTQKKELDS